MAQGFEAVQVPESNGLPNCHQIIASLGMILTLLAV